MTLSKEKKGGERNCLLWLLKVALVNLEGESLIQRVMLYNLNKGIEK